MRSFHLIVNSSSGNGSAAASGIRVARLLRDAGAATTLTHSLTAEQARQSAVEAVEQGSIVVAVGGDGTVGALAGAVLATGGTLGIVPGGRGNDFARQLGLPKEPEPLARLLLEGPKRAVDVIKVGDRIVVGSVYAGIDSLASQLVDKAHRLPRPLQYPLASLLAIAKHRPTTYSIKVDGRGMTLDAHTVVVANSGYYGSGMHVAPGAAVDDGILSIVLIRAMPRLRLVKALRMVYDGSHAELEEVTVLEGRQVSIASTGPVTAYGDGERISPLPVLAQVLPGALQVLA